MDNLKKILNKNKNNTFLIYYTYKIMIVIIIIKFKTKNISKIKSVNSIRLLTEIVNLAKPHTTKTWLLNQKTETRKSCCFATLYYVGNTSKVQMHASLPSLDVIIQHNKSITTGAYETHQQNEKQYIIFTILRLLDTYHFESYQNTQHLVHIISLCSAFL